MNDTLHILVADYVPLANRGEEAIVRGIEDMLSGGRPVALGLFDNVPEVTERDNITVFPREWVFRFEGNASLSPWRRVLLQLAIASQLRLGRYARLRNLTAAGNSSYRALHDFFARAEYVVVGHDGVFCVESCGIVRLAKAHGKRTGILGASTGIGAGRWYKAGLYRRVMDESDFCIFRERPSCESLRRISHRPEKLRVGPDPAFAMRPAPPQQVAERLARSEGYCRARAAGRSIVAATVLETGRVYAGFRPDLEGRVKQQAHAEYLAGILDAMVAQRRAFVLFLPHSVEDHASDVTAARHVTEQMKSRPGDYEILEEDCGARLLKGIIRACDFVIGERTHSLIGSVAVATPFAALTNRRDTRTHGIIGEMCQCGHQILDMDVTDGPDAARRVLEIYDSRASIRGGLRQMQQRLSEQLLEISRLIEGRTHAHPSP